MPFLRSWGWKVMNCALIREIADRLAEQCGSADHMLPITIAIDKLDKIGIENVKEELRERGLDGRHRFQLSKPT
jgi:hypothetical protein